MDDVPSPQRAYKRHKSYPGETSFIARPPSSDMDNVALGQEFALEDTSRRAYAIALLHNGQLPLHLAAPNRHVLIPPYFDFLNSIYHSLTRIQEEMFKSAESHKRFSLAFLQAQLDFMHQEIVGQVAQQFSESELQFLLTAGFNSHGRIVPPASFLDYNRPNRTPSPLRLPTPLLPPGIGIPPPSILPTMDEIIPPMPASSMDPATRPPNAENIPPMPASFFISRFEPLDPYIEALWFKHFNECSHPTHENCSLQLFGPGKYPSDRLIQFTPPAPFYPLDRPVRSTHPSPARIPNSRIPN